MWIDRGMWKQWDLLFRPVSLPDGGAGGSTNADDADWLRLSTRRWALVGKRLCDIGGALIGLVCCGLVYLWYAPRLRRESPGPVFFRQTRIGCDGRPFTLLKFRTMCLDAEARLAELLPANEMQGPLFKMRDDPRVTPSGQMLRNHHLDELPQCWNVLKGDMSLIGVRPPTPQEVVQYRPDHHLRLRMKPGISGLWQVQRAHGITDFEDVVRLDCYYIDYWSLWLDGKIVAKTFLTVVLGHAR